MIETKKADALISQQLEKVNKVMNPYEQFGQWLEKQPYWVQDAAWRLYHKQPIDETQVNQYVQMCIDQAQKKSVSYQTIDNYDLDGSGSKRSLSIDSIYDIKSVNALAEDTNLTFNANGLTVVYGLNGAGKSGFMRIFKHVSGHPHAEQIQQNIFKQSSGLKPSCKFDIAIGGNKQTIEVDLTLQKKDSYLSQCDVFDTRISNAYISNSNSVSYEPFVFTVLRELAIIAGKIQFAIQSKIDSLPSLTLNYPDFVVDYPSAKWLELLTAETIIPSECCKWEESDSKRFDELSSLLDLKQVQTSIKNKRYQLSQIEKILNELQEIKNRITSRYTRELQEQYAEYIKSKNQYELSRSLFTEHVTGQDMLSISMDDWKTLWQVARSYYEKSIHQVNGNEFAKPGSICPLCLQRIDGDTLERFSSIDEYVNGSFSVAYDNATKKYRDTFAKIIEHTYTSVQAKDALEEIVSTELINSIVNFYEQIEHWSQDILSETAYEEIVNIKELKFVSELYDEAETLRETIESLEIALNQEKQKELKNELRQLKYRQWAFQNLDLINSIIFHEQQKVKARLGLQLVKTNRITSESNYLAEVLITDAYIQRFNTEMKALAPNLKVILEKVQSKKGRSPYKVVLDTDNKLRKNPEDILSEGEQRIVALAAFFADATGRTERTPIIIDDPISSLDYNYEDAATKRIVELAKNRQVIVFTHRISLLVGLSEKCESRKVPFNERYIRGINGYKGIPDFEDVYHGKLPAQLNGIIDRIQAIKNKDHYSREYIDACSRVSQQLRICVERSIEDVLFQQMVKRFSRRIMTGKLMKMNRITNEDCSVIDSMMTKYSFGEHSQPEDSPLIEMNLDEVISDIKSFISWIKNYNNKMNEQ